jgi:O-antigen/teichoic acid export membrane protein
MDLNRGLKRDTIINYCIKFLNMGIALLMVRFTLGYLGEDNYGVWATILSIITVVAAGDFGIGNGLKNRVAESLARNNQKEIKEYISTSYICIFVIALFIFMLSYVAVVIYGDSFLSFIYGNDFFKYEGVRTTLFIMVTTICINFVVGLINSVLMGHQKSGIVSIGYLLNSLFLLIGIFIIKQVSSGSLVFVGFVYNISMVSSNLVLNILFFSKNKSLFPKFKYFRKDKIRNTMGISMKFFVLQCCSMILFCADSIIIMKLISARAVTTYKVINQVYDSINALYATLFFPIWSAVTYAYTNKDTRWLKKLIKKLSLTLPLLGVLLLVIGLLFNTIVFVWLQKDIKFSANIIIVFSLYSLVMGWNAMFTSIINGMGKINLYLWISITIAAAYIPLAVFYSNNMGMDIYGIKLATLTCQTLPAIILPIQVFREIKKIDKEAVEK